MNEYEIRNMTIDNVGFTGEEYVTADFKSQDQDYSVTFNKADLQMDTSWVLQNGTQFPTKIPNNLIESVREDVKKRI